MHLKRCLLFITLWLSAAGAASAFAQGASAAPACPTPLRVGMSQLGIAYFKQDGEHRGYDVELVRELSTRLGCKFEIIEMSRMRIFQSLEAGEFIDFATSASQTPERDRFAHFIPLATTRNYLLVHKRLVGPNGFDLNQFTAQPKLVMGLLAGSNYGAFINARLAVMTQQGRTQSAAQIDQLLPRLLAGRYDGLIVTLPYFIAALRELPGGADIRALPIPESDPYLSGFYMSRAAVSEARREQIRKVMETVHQDGTLLRIYRKYFSEAQARERSTFAPSVRETSSAK